MDFLKVNAELIRYLDKCFPEVSLENRAKHKSWGTYNCFYSFGTSVKGVHYEYFASLTEGGSVSLHFENVAYYPVADFYRFKRVLKQATEGHPDLKWDVWQNSVDGRCLLKKDINNEADIVDAVSKLKSIFDPLIEDYQWILSEKMICSDGSDIVVSDELLDDSEDSKTDDVVLLTRDIQNLFKGHLTIPPYQRNYCWDHVQVNNLWESLVGVKDEYHLGTIILQQKTKDGSTTYDVIDGQQRLVTLSLILHQMGHKGALPLMKASFKSQNSVKQVALNKRLIRDLYNTNTTDFLDRILKAVKFSVVLLKNPDPDLAYTFFSNQNSNGVELSDYDLLKAHHLRYVRDNQCAEAMAKRWNGYANEEDEVLPETLGCHLYRMRKWNCKKINDEKQRRKVKEEYSAVPCVIEPSNDFTDIDFKNKIEGGQFFFEYSDKYVKLYKSFCETNQYLALESYFNGEKSMNIYKSVIETCLFAFYIKFEKRLLSDALFCIAMYFAKHRFKSDSVGEATILTVAKDSEIINLIDQSRCPEMFVSDLLPRTRLSRLSLERPVKKQFYNGLKAIFIGLNDIAVDEIKERIKIE